MLDKDLAIRDVDILPDLHDTDERYSAEDFADAERVIVGNRPDILFLKHGSSTFRQSCNPVCSVRPKPAHYSAEIVFLPKKACQN